MILREPGKATNSITTDPKIRMIFAEREGRFLAKPYLDQASPASSVCRINVSKVTVFHEDSLTLEVPDHLQYSDEVITPRRDFAEIDLSNYRVIFNSCRKICAYCSKI